MSDIVIAIGRVLIAAIFIGAGLGKLLDIDAAQTFIAARPLPQALEWLTEGSTLTALAWTAGIVELLAGLMVALGFGVRLAAFALIVVSALAIYFVHPFWTMTGGAKAASSVQVLMNLSIIGALMMLLGAGAGPYSIGPNGALGLQRRDPWDSDA